MKCERGTIIVVWEPPIAYTGVVTGYLVESSYFCEYKPLLDARNMERVPPGKARKMARKMLEALKKIPKRGRGFVKLTFAGEIASVPVIVSPDAVYYEYGNPKAVIKAKKRKNLRIYPGDWAPLLLSAMILARENPDLNLSMILAVGESQSKLAMALSSLKIHGPKPALGDGWKIVTKIFDMISYGEELIDKINLLAGRRIPKHYNGLRCKFCPYSNMCPARGSQ